MWPISHFSEIARRRAAALRTMECSIATILRDGGSARLRNQRAPTAAAVGSKNSTQ
jgi:hypothetical protein